MPTYKIVRFYQRTETLATGLPLEEAQRHCEDPEMSSTTATSPEAQERTAKSGAWFDTWFEE